MEFQERFNQHIQKIIDLKGRAFDVQRMKWVGLSKKNEAELLELEASLPRDDFSDLEEFFKRRSGMAKKQNDGVTS